MGRYFYRQGDLYVGWSSVVDAPVYWGTRDEVLAYAIDQDREKPEYARPRIEEALERARDGAVDPDYLAMYQQYGLLPLGKLREWLETFDETTQTFAVQGFIKPFEDDPDRELPDRG